MVIAIITCKYCYTTCTLRFLFGRRLQMFDLLTCLLTYGMCTSQAKNNVGSNEVGSFCIHQSSDIYLH